MHIGIISLCLIIIIIPYPDNISNYKNGVCLICLLHIFKCATVYFYHGSEHYEPPPYFSQGNSLIWTFYHLDWKLVCTCDWKFHLNIFVIYISRLLRFRGRFCFTCLVSSFRSLSSLCFGQRKKSGHNIVFKCPFLWRKVYVIRSIWRKVFGADYCAFCHLEVIFGGNWLSPYSTFPYIKW